MNLKDVVGVTAIREISFGRKPNVEVVFLPGALASRAQLEPILPVLQRLGYVDVCDYDPVFDGAVTADAITAFVEETVDMGREIVLFGVGLGGQLAFDACCNLTTGKRRSTHVVMVDTSAGADTLRDVPKWAETLLGLPLGPLGWLNVPVAKTGLLPKDENVVLSGSLDEEAAVFYRAAVRESARRDLAGHKVGTLQRQLRYMAQLDLSQGFTNTVGLAGLAYIACTGDNTTVRQPEAAQAWHRATWSCKVFEVATAHAAFLEARPVWVQRLPEIFREIGLLH